MLSELRKQLDNKEISSVELTQQYLAQAKAENTKLNAYVTITEEHALAQAKAADAALAKGESSRFLGIPYAAKDIFCTKDIETTASSNMLRGYKPPYDATVIEKLSAGVLLGKTNTDEFAMGASTENSAFGPTLNPFDTSRVAGGSSGGSAAAVAAKLAPFALGTDTGGSIRYPASFCGVVGLRPTYGRVSRYGVMPMASSLDTIAPVAESVADVAYILEGIAGQDWHDSTTSDRSVEEYTKLLDQPTTKPLRVGMPKEYFEVEGLDPQVKQMVEQVIKKLEQTGAQIIPVSLPHTRYAIPTYYILVPSEVSSNLAKFDGIRFGFRANDANDLTEVYTHSRGQGFGPEAKRRIMLGTYTLSAGFYDAYYQKAMKVRTLIRQDFTKAFEQVDVLIAPTSPTTAFKVGEKAADPIAMYLEDVFVAPASLAGVPAMSVPMGEISGLPIGVQIIGNQWQEATVLRVGKTIEGLVVLD